MSSKNVIINLELGHKASVRAEKSNTETHDWEVFVQGQSPSRIDAFVEKVVFYLHNSFPKPKRVVKKPPYSVVERGYGGFTLPIEIHFKTTENPRRTTFYYDLYLQPLDDPSFEKIRTEKLTFTCPNEQFRKKLLQGGGTEVPAADAKKTNEKSAKSQPSNGAKTKPRSHATSSNKDANVSKTEDNYAKKNKIENKKEVTKSKGSDQFTALFGESVIFKSSDNKLKQSKAKEKSPKSERISDSSKYKEKIKEVKMTSPTRDKEKEKKNDKEKKHLSEDKRLKEKNRNSKEVEKDKTRSSRDRDTKDRSSKEKDRKNRSSKEKDSKDRSSKEKDNKDRSSKERIIKGRNSKEKDKDKYKDERRSRKDKSVDKLKTNEHKHVKNDSVTKCKERTESPVQIKSASPSHKRSVCSPHNNKKNLSPPHIHNKSNISPMHTGPVSSSHERSASPRKKSASPAHKRSISPSHKKKTYKRSLSPIGKSPTPKKLKSPSYHKKSRSKFNEERSDSPPEVKKERSVSPPKIKKANVTLQKKKNESLSPSKKNEEINASPPKEKRFHEVCIMESVHSKVKEEKNAFPAKKKEEKNAFPANKKEVKTAPIKRSASPRPSDLKVNKRVKKEKEEKINETKEKREKMEKPNKKEEEKITMEKIKHQVLSQVTVKEKPPAAPIQAKKPNSGAMRGRPRKYPRPNNPLNLLAEQSIEPPIHTSKPKPVFRATPPTRLIPTAPSPAPSPIPPSALPEKLVKRKRSSSIDSFSISSSSSRHSSVVNSRPGSRVSSRSNSRSLSISPSRSNSRPKSNSRSGSRPKSNSRSVSRPKSHSRSTSRSSSSSRSRSRSKSISIKSLSSSSSRSSSSSSWDSVELHDNSKKLKDIHKNRPENPQLEGRGSKKVAENTLQNLSENSNSDSETESIPPPKDELNYYKNSPSASKVKSSPNKSSSRTLSKKRKSSVSPALSERSLSAEEISLEIKDKNKQISSPKNAHSNRINNAYIKSNGNIRSKSGHSASVASPSQSSKSHDLKIASPVSKPIRTAHVASPIQSKTRDCKLASPDAIQPSKSRTAHVASTLPSQSNGVTSPTSDNSPQNFDPESLQLLVELKNKIVACFSDRSKLQEVVQIIGSATSFHVNNAHMTFDLCALDKQTIKKLQQCLS